MPDLTQLLVAWNSGDREALDALMPMVYEELRRLARFYMKRERPDHTLEPTALVHEAYLRLVDQNRVEWQNRAHFLGVAAQLMRRVALKHAQKHNAAKRGGGAVKVPLEEAELGGPKMRDVDLIALDEALGRLESLDGRQAQIVVLRFFGGLTVDETSEVMAISTATVHRDWRMARAWLQRELKTQGGMIDSEPVPGVTD